MSLIASLLGWTKLPSWAMELLAILLVVVSLYVGLSIWKHHAVETGVQEQIQRDNVALQGLKTANAEKEKALLKRATVAEENYALEHANNLTPPPITGPLLVCDDPHSGAGDLPKASTLKPGDAASPATSTVGGPVYTADSPSPEDRRRLLGAVASLFDDQTAVIREFQSR